MFISAAFAQGAADAGPGGFGLVQLAPLVLIFVVFYFLLIRPQQKKMKLHRDMVAALRRGDRVVTAGGIIGLVTKVLNDKELQVEIAEGVRVRVTRASVTDLVAKTEPAPANDADDDEDKAEKK
jgi:preprotein translocase subunit YajC